MSAEVLFETWPVGDKQIGVVTLDAPKTLNSLSLDMIDLMYPKLMAWKDDDSIITVFFQATGDRAFSAGGDIQNLYHDMVEHPGGPCPYCDAFFEREYRLDYLIQTYPKPTVAWGHGIVMGGGLGVMSGCQYRVGTETTRIAMPEITIGLFPDAGATVSFSRMPAHFSHFLAWTGANINGEDAREVGLVTHLINHEHKDAFVAAMCALDDVTAGLPGLLEDFASRSGDFPASQLLNHQAVIREVTEAALASDNPVRAFLEGSSKFEGDKWLDRARLSFAGGSPTTAAIIPEQFSRAASMTREEMFQQELVIGVQCSRHAEFVEGVRALLIDKDGNPNWQYPLGEVPLGVVEEFFTAPWPANPLADLG